MKYPRFDFFPGDWRSDTNNNALTLEEKGAHIELLCLMWDRPTCAVPDDDAMIARQLHVPLATWRRIRRALVHPEYGVLVAEGGEIFSRKLRGIRQNAEEVSQKRRRAAQERWENREPALEHTSGDAHGDADNMHMHDGSTENPMQNVPHARVSNLHSPISTLQSPSGDHRDPPAERRGASGDEPSADFLTMWADYPLKVERKAAWRAWKAAVRKGVPIADLTRAGQHYATYCQQAGTPAPYIKHGATFFGRDDPWRDWVDGVPVRLATGRARDHPPAWDVLAEALHQEGE